MVKIKDPIIARVSGCKYMGICARCNFKFYFNMSQQKLEHAILTCPLCKIGDVNVYETK